ncbi:hypothetical protein MJG53_004539 [Ovis ammon polii x Ovis aries]|uniref:Uncharacterized protein n=1 Tax=Ovis ammon polii x Ovis aries TaxID=2918886 RepID=A0ACB9VAG1_9CETA|nr:hypothetical protein MJG53_004539 [Ovis ammon polii x Ovis aries]
MAVHHNYRACTLEPDVELSPSSAPEHLVSIQTNGTACLPKSRTRGRKELQAAEKLQEDARTRGESNISRSTKTSDAATTPKLGRLLPGTGEQPSGIQAPNLKGQSSDQSACDPRP